MDERNAVLFVTGDAVSRFTVNFDLEGVKVYVPLAEVIDILPLEVPCLFVCRTLAFPLDKFE